MVDLSQCPVCPTVPLGVLRTSQGLPNMAVVPVSCLSHSPIGSPWDIPRTPTLGSCPSVLPVPQSHRESSGHPKYSHPWWLSQCPVCPTVPPGVLRTSQVLPPLVVVPVSRLSHSSTGSPQTLPPLAVVPVSCLSHSPIGSPQDIPRILLGHLRAQCVNNPPSQVKHDRLKLEVTQHTFNTCLH